MAHVHAKHAQHQRRERSRPRAVGPCGPRAPDRCREGPWHFTMSLDGFVAGPNHAMGWMSGITFRTGLVEEYAETTGAVLGGRDGWEAYPDASGICG